jgi:hypothetical protein
MPPAFSDDSVFLERKVTLEVDHSKVGEILRILAARASVPIGFEGLPDEKVTKPLTIHMRATVREVLDRIVESDPRYEWEISDSVVNVVPRAPANKRLLDVVIHNVSFENVDAEKLGSLIIDLPDVKARLAELGLMGSRASEYDGPLRDLPVFSVAKSEVVLSDLLNEILRKGYTNYWATIRFGESNQYVAIRM